MINVKYTLPSDVLSLVLPSSNQLSDIQTCFVPRQFVANESYMGGGSNFTTIASAFAEGADGFKVTTKLLKNIVSYSKQIKSRDDHINFFGGNLLGTDRIRFYTTDRDRWFDDILEVDEEYLKQCLHKVPAINTDWVVSSDVFNISCIWLVHEIMRTFGTRDKLAYEAMVEVLVMLQFRFLTSIYSNYFRKPVDEEAAIATYAALTLKFKLRQLGSWGDLLRDRAESYLEKQSPHYDALTRFDDDEKVIYVVTDLQTRTRKTIKDMYAVLDKVRSNNLRVQTAASTLVLDGDKIIRDRVSCYNVSRDYLFDVSGNTTSFIKRELVDVVLDIMGTVSEANFLDILMSISNTPTGRGRDEVEWMMDNTLIHAFNYIAKNRITFNDVGYILVKMRALYMSSKTTDPLLLSLRTRIEKYAKRHSKLTSPAALASARTSIMLYFLLRALSAQAYR